METSCLVTAAKMLAERFEYPNKNMGWKDIQNMHTKDVYNIG